MSIGAADIFGRWLDVFIVARLKAKFNYILFIKYIDLIYLADKGFGKGEMDFIQ